ARVPGGAKAARARVWESVISRPAGCALLATQRLALRRPLSVLSRRIAWSATRHDAAKLLVVGPRWRVGKSASKRRSAAVAREQAERPVARRTVLFGWLYV